MYGGDDILIQDPVEWAHPLNQGLVSWWLALPSLPRGNRWHDLTRRNPGTLTGGPAWGGARGRPGGFGRLTFAGSNYVALGDPAALAIAAGNCTLAAWVRVTAKAANGLNAGILGRSTDGKPVTRVIGLDVYGNAPASGAPQVQLYDGANNPFARHSGSVVGAGWTHVCGVRDSGTLRLYLDGVQVATAADTAGDVSGAGQVWSFGRQAYTDFAEPLQGDADDARVYPSRALDAASVAALYAESLAGYPNALRRVRRAAWSVPAAPGGGVPLGTLALLGCGR